MSTYAWIITTDHLYEPGDDLFENETGVVGPRSASGEAVAAVQTGKGRLFRMYDGDGELYYTGRLYDLSGEYGEEACYAPLGDFGMPNAGAVEVKYHGHPEMDCG